MGTTASLLIWYYSSVVAGATSSLRRRNHRIAVEPKVDEKSRGIYLWCKCCLVYMQGTMDQPLGLEVEEASIK